MKQNLTTWKLIDRSLKNNISTVLLYVSDSKGSSPGRKGFMMAVNALNEIEGTIGGGIMEHKFVEWSKNILKLEKEAIFLQKQVHDKSVSDHQSGMICSGEQTNLLYLIKASDIPIIGKIIEALENNICGYLQFSNNGINFSTKSNENRVGLQNQETESWCYVERIGLINNIYIVGGGHCALAFSKVIAMLNFSVYLFDNRKDLNTFNDNNWAQYKTIVDDYSNLSNLIPEGDNNYVVIMTQGYRTDDIAIRSLWNKKFGYIGVLGSRYKIDKMFTQYRNEGMDEAILSLFHAPVGLPINSRTPEEIAVSIAAEIIKVKNCKKDTVKSNF